jgi:hypothetical protein
MRNIDADSLIRAIKVRLKWHKDLEVEEVIRMIKDAPTVIPAERNEDATD